MFLRNGWLGSKVMIGCAIFFEIGQAVQLRHRIPLNEPQNVRSDAQGGVAHMPGSRSERWEVGHEGRAPGTKRRQTWQVRWRR